MTVDTYLHQGKRWMARRLTDPRVRRTGKMLAVFGAGFFLGGASLGNFPQPFAMACVSAMTGWRALVMALGSAAGYRLFWGGAGDIGVLWSVLSGISALGLGKTKLNQRAPLIIPALCGLWAAAGGLLFQFLGQDIPILIYFLWVGLALALSRMFAVLKQKPDPVLIWAAQGIGVLALAQAAPLPWLNFGCIAAGALAAAESFPAAALAGLALDLSRISPVSMTAVTAAAWLCRLIPGIPDKLRRLAPGSAYLLVSVLSGQRTFSLAGAFFLGGLLSAVLPGTPKLSHRRGETGMAQVRLELMAGVMSQMQQLLLEVQDIPIDEEALMARTRERACGSCPNRKQCRFTDPIPAGLLHRPLTENTALPFLCRKPGRMILEIRRSQEQYRHLRAHRERRRECRGAVIQQYSFLAEFLRDTADRLPQRDAGTARFRVEAGIASRSREEDNGDRCIWFPGTENQAFLLLCDGMGTGLGAAREGSEAQRILKQMLCAGFPAEHALRSLNSLLALRGRAGAVTVDLVQLRLDTGRAVIYKWGAAPSCLLRFSGTEKIGTAGPPPGLDANSVRETVHRLSLGRGEALIIASDGVDLEPLRRRAVDLYAASAGEMADKLLKEGAADSADDATVAVVRLHPQLPST